MATRMFVNKKPRKSKARQVLKTAPKRAEKKTATPGSTRMQVRMAAKGIRRG